VVDYLLEEDSLTANEKRQRDALMLSAHLNLAACHLKLNDNLDAVHDCDNALEMQPRNEKALYRRATVRLLYHHSHDVFSSS